MITTYQEYMTKKGLSEAKQAEIKRECGILGKYIYRAPNMLLKMISRWATDPIRVRYVARQNSGSWGPWYHYSRQILNPVTDKWIFLEECGRLGKTTFDDADAQIKVII
jgi:hypothetical protein